MALVLKRIWLVFNSGESYYFLPGCLPLSIGFQEDWLMILEAKIDDK